MCGTSGCVRVCRPDVERNPASAGRATRVADAEEATHELQGTPVLVQRYNFGVDVAEGSGSAGNDYVVLVHGVNLGRGPIHHVAIDLWRDELLRRLIELRPEIHGDIGLAPNPPVPH